MTIRRDSQRALAVAGAIALATFALYWPVRHFDFVYYDDSEYVFENPTVQEGLTGWGVVWAFVMAHASNWHPVTWISHMADCQFFGLQAGAHHLMNAAFHAANGALLFLALRSLTGAFWRCAFVAALFAWHPLRVESVAWISERKDVLSGFFFLLTLLAYAQYAGTRRQVFYSLTLVLFIFGLLSKPMLVTVPCVLLLLDYWPLGRLRIESGRGVIRNAMPLLKEKIPFFLMALLVGVITLVSQSASKAMIPLRSEGLGLRLDEAVVGYAQYLGKFVWPRGLSVVYLRPDRIPIGTFVPALLLLLIISWAALRLGRPYLTVGWLWFVGMLLPVSGLLQAGLQSIADRYTYLPGIGLGIVLAWGISEASDLAAGQSKSAGRWRWIAVGALVMALGASAVLTRDELSYWRDTETLMTRALAIDPQNYVACEDLAKYYAQHAQPEKARQMRQRAVELDPVFHNQ